jgi:tRNA(fMet)-specific endonuclease VapC
MKYILDTDHLTLLKRNHPAIINKFRSIASDNIFITIVTVEEQIRGRLAIISKVSTQPEKFTLAYNYLFDTLQDFHSLNVLKLDPNAVEYFQELKRQKIRIGTQDLKIARIALARQAIMVTRNNKDFAQVPNLQIEDWSLE